MYLIRGFCHQRDMDMAAHSFLIDLSADIPAMVSRSGLTQENIDQHIETCGDHWLDACGYDAPFDYDGKKERLYKARESIRVSWGKWGPEHITVPGNACGLDIDLSGGFGCLFPGGRSLHPHNLDGWQQKYLLTIVFTEIMENVALFSRRGQ